MTGWRRKGAVSGPGGSLEEDVEEPMVAIRPGKPNDAAIFLPSGVTVSSVPKPQTTECVSVSKSTADRGPPRRPSSTCAGTNMAETRAGLVAARATSCSSRWQGLDHSAVKS